METKKLLVFNTGSSSIKYTLFNGNSQGNEKLFSGKQEKIEDYNKAIDAILNILDGNSSKFDIIAHRIVHGGDSNKSCLIDGNAEKIIERYSEFAPLHNPPQLNVIQICKKFKKKQYAVFDTAFFSELPDKTKYYPIPEDIRKKHNIRKYGFHGISHKSMARGLNGKTITIHLGSGCSISAILDSKPIDTSMGLTPLEGLMMGTRAGDIDPGIIVYLSKENYDLENILNYKSGLKAFSEENDFRYYLDNLDKPKIKLGFDIFAYRIVKYIGAYAAALNGLENMVFSGAIGQGSSLLRESVCKNLSYLGVELDEDKNRKNEEVISSLNSKVNVYAKKTDEESEIAREVYEII